MPSAVVNFEEIGREKGRPYLWVNWNWAKNFQIFRRVHRIVKSDY